MAQYYPPAGFHFRVEFNLDGIKDSDVRFQEVSGLSAELGVEEVTEGGENRFPHRLPTRAKYSNLTLKRGLLTDSRLIDWCKNAIENFDFEPTTNMPSNKCSTDINSSPIFIDSWRAASKTLAIS